MMNILITSSSNKVALVKRYKIAALNYNDIKIYTGDITTEVPTSLFSDEHLILPKDDDPLYKEKLLEICTKNYIKMIIPTRDEELNILSAMRKDLKHIDCQVLVSPTHTIEICQFKDKFFNFCENNDIPVPITYRESSPDNFPVFIKPVVGKASKNVKRIDSQSEFDAIDKEEYITQEYVDWQEYTIDVFSDFNYNVVSLVPRKRLKVVNGESYIAETEKNQTIIDSVLDLSKKLQLIGHCVIQCFYKEDKVKFIEVNLRYGGSSNLSFESGANIPEFVIQLMKNGVINYDLYNFKNKLKTYRYVTDAFVNDDIKNKIFCIDIDGTICTEGTEYENVSPIQKVIDKINLLYENNVIILYTARGASSGFDWEPLTSKQLREWGVKYHKLIMGKPFADYYIDNKAINIMDWV